MHLICECPGSVDVRGPDLNGCGGFLVLHDTDASGRGRRDGRRVMMDAQG